MRAKKVYESVDFQRGKDPKSAMDLGYFRDKNGNIIQLGDSVETEGGDAFEDWYFEGVVDSFHGEYVIVRDWYGDYFDIEPHKLEVLD